MYSYQFGESFDEGLNPNNLNGYVLSKVFQPDLTNTGALWASNDMVTMCLILFHHQKNMVRKYLLADASVRLLKTFHRLTFKETYNARLMKLAYQISGLD